MTLPIILELWAYEVPNSGPKDTNLPVRAAEVIQRLNDALRHILGGSLSLPRFAEEEARDALAFAAEVGPCLHGKQSSWECFDCHTDAWDRAASGMEARRAETVKHGSVHDGPTAEGGDAQNTSESPHEQG